MWKSWQQSSKWENSHYFHSDRINQATRSPKWKFKSWNGKLKVKPSSSNLNHFGWRQNSHFPTSFDWKTSHLWWCKFRSCHVIFPKHWNRISLQLVLSAREWLFQNFHLTTSIGFFSPFKQGWTGKLFFHGAGRLSLLSSIYPLSIYQHKEAPS